MSNNSNVNFIFAGGGTGGHLFPAIAVAEALRSALPEAKISFIGRADKIEGTTVPKYGFEFFSIKAEGFSRKNPLVNLRVIYKFVTGFFRCLKLTIKFKPAAVVTTGAYISAPLLASAKIMGSKIVMIEPNSYPGLTTRLFDRSADEIYTAFEETAKYLRVPGKAIVTGNPVRQSFKTTDRAEAKTRLGFDPDKKLVVISGGSLGARAINQAVLAMLPQLENNGIQCYWQTGKNYFEQYKNLSSRGLVIVPFIDNMSDALNAADVLISRAGATTLAEISALGIASILIPSPNVAENHQYFNAKSLEDRNAAINLEEKYIGDRLAGLLLELIRDESRLNEIRVNAKLLHRENTSGKIVERILNLTGIKGNK